MFFLKRFQPTEPLLRVNVVLCVCVRAFLKPEISSSSDSEYSSLPPIRSIISAIIAFAFFPPVIFVLKKNWNFSLRLVFSHRPELEGRVHTVLMCSLTPSASDVRLWREIFVNRIEQKTEHTRNTNNTHLVDLTLRFPLRDFSSSE